jgi:hypothetical protein
MPENFESKEPCICCNKWAPGFVTYHHLKTRKAHPELEHEPKNMIPVCQAHHNQFHAKGISHMCEKYPRVKDWMQRNGWSYDTFLARWIINL